MNAHDVAAIEALLADHCQFEAARVGVGADGRADVAKARVAWLDAHQTYELKTLREFFSGDEGYNEWRFIAKTLDCEPVETHGIDYFRFADGKIVEKNSFRKI